MKCGNKYVLYFSIIMFGLGLIYIITHRSIDVLEPFVLSSCPDTLIKKDGDYYLYNSAIPEYPGKNQIKFQHLDEYAHFIRWHNNKGRKCPVLFLQQEYDTQGDRNFKVYVNKKGKTQKLLDANRDNTDIYNNNSYPGFDPLNLYIGTNTPLDKMFHEKTKISDNPMDKNWGGVQYTQSKIDNGFFDDDKVVINMR